MFVELRKDDPRPVYRQIADELQRAISVGVLKPGESLPATRQLARTNGRHALCTMCIGVGQGIALIIERV